MAKPPAKRGGKTASLASHTASKEQIAEIVRNNAKWLDMSAVKTDDECADRLNMFFSTCAEMGELPTVEKMSLALGVTRAAVWNWEQGDLGSARAAMIRKAKEVLAGIDAELAATGRINNSVYIFRAKNFYGLRDVVETVTTHTDPLGESQDLTTLAKKYRVAVPDIIDVDFKEELT